jgi:hypothetical protein
MNATRGTRLILKAQQEIGVIEKSAIQNLARHGAVSHPNLLSQENRTHPARAQAADNAKTTGQSAGKLHLGWRGQSGKQSAVARTELNIIGVGLLAGVADLHGRPVKRSCDGDSSRNIAAKGSQ